MKIEIYVDTISNKKLIREIQYHVNGKIKNEYYYLDGELHREDGPANIWYYDNGVMCSEHYLLNGKYHRDNGFAKNWYFSNGIIDDAEYWINGKLITDPLQIFVIETLGTKIK